MTGIEVFAYGFLGGAIPEFYALYKLRHSWHKSRPDWYSSPFFWITTLFMIALGGGTAFLYQITKVNLNELAAIHLGASTPVILQTFSKSKPKVD